MTIFCPVKKTVHGPVTSQAELVKTIAMSGQFFGVDESGPACNFNPLYPCDQSLYTYKGWGPHKGLDITVVTGTEIYAATQGKVVEVSDDVTAGIGVVIFDDQQKCKTVYWHLQRHVVQLGAVVAAGDLIAYSDTTGYASGPHLHFELKETDDTGRSLNHIDPLPHFVWPTSMTKEHVRNLYRLAFYREPTQQESDFWTGKELSEFLKTALVDRAAFLAQP